MYRVALDRICKQYLTGAGQLHVLNNISLNVEPGEFIAIQGPSGCGKSTLLNIIGCLDRCDSGRYLFDGRDVFGLNDDDMASLRQSDIGFVFQAFNLVPRLNALRNVELPMIYGGLSKRQCRERAIYMLEQVGLGDKIEATPAQLSGGQQQRVAIARALANDPSLLLLDEPTGNLDSSAGQMIMDLFADLNVRGKTIIAVTHDSLVAARAERVLQMRDGHLFDLR